MKIVHVLPSLARGGGERLMIELANREAAAGHQVTVIAGHPLPPERTTAGLSSDVELRFITHSMASRATRYLPLLPFLLRHQHWLRQQDVIHCHLTYGAVFGTLVRALTRHCRGGRPAIVETYHGVGMPIPMFHRWLHARMAATRDALSFMAEEKYWLAFMNRHPKLKAEIIPVGVAAPHMGPIGPLEKSAYRAEVGIPADCRLVVGTIGRLAPERQSHRYVPVFAQIASEMGPEVHFFMGGDGPDRQKIETAVVQQKLEDRIHLAGLVQHIEFPLSITDLYVTSNIGSVPGVAGLQAVAAGVPVIAIQLLEGYTASPSDWIWSSRDPEAVADRAIELLRSESLRRKLAQHQAAHLQANHSAETMALRYQQLYEEAIASRR